MLNCVPCPFFQLIHLSATLAKPSTLDTVNHGYWGCEYISKLSPSKLIFVHLSKLVERAVTAQLTKYMTTNDLFEPLQSGYRPNHSPETAIVTVLNDLLTALDSKNSVLLSLLDCSAAFDLVSHSTLLHRLSHCLGIRDTALEWFKSYLTNRSQSVSLIGHTSPRHPIL